MALQRKLIKKIEPLISKFVNSSKKKDDISRFFSEDGKSSFINPYSHPLAIKMTDLLEKNHVYDYSYRTPYAFIFPLTLLFASIAKFSSISEDIFDNLKFVLSKRLMKRYSKKQVDKIMEYFIFSHLKFLARVFFEDMLLFPSLIQHRKFLSNFIDLHGVENLENALKKGNGVILICPHFGNQLITTTLLAMKGFKCAQVIDLETERAFERHYKRTGLKLIDTSNKEKAR
ncbi:MAG: LpxL/LpxP family acyltransferase, partial [Candidatus Helarchaeales archaeon]